jgi:hypothetical protein
MNAERSRIVGGGSQSDGLGLTLGPHAIGSRRERPTSVAIRRTRRDAPDHVFVLRTAKSALNRLDNLPLGGRDADAGAECWSS